MKKFLLFIMALCSISLVGCTDCTGSYSNQGVESQGTQQEAGIPVQQEDVTTTFDKFGFSVRTPCVLEDVSAQVHGHFEANYGGMINEDDPENMTAYQVAVIKLPIGVEDYPKEEIDDIVDLKISEMMSNFSNVEKVLFSDEEYPGYVGDTNSNGVNQRGVIFKKDRFIITLTVLTNSDMEHKFNRFTNSFKVI